MAVFVCGCPEVHNIWYHDRAPPDVCAACLHAKDFGEDQPPVATPATTGVGLGDLGMEMPDLDYQ